MQKDEQNRLVNSDFQNRLLTHYKVPKYTFRKGFMQIRVAEKLSYILFVIDVKNWVGLPFGVSHHFFTMGNIGRGVIFYESPCNVQTLSQAESSRFHNYSFCACVFFICLCFQLFTL